MFGTNDEAATEDAFVDSRYVMERSTVFRTNVTSTSARGSTPPAEAIQS